MGAIARPYDRRGDNKGLRKPEAFSRIGPFGLFASVISSASQSVVIARAVTYGGYGDNVVSRLSSTGPPTVKW